MKKIALAAFSATAMLALAACDSGTEEPVVEETTIVEDVAPLPVETAIVEATPAVEETAAAETPAE
jgi:hypothetical protein